MKFECCFISLLNQICVVLEADIAPRNTAHISAVLWQARSSKLDAVVAVNEDLLFAGRSSKSLRQLPDRIVRFVLALYSRHLEQRSKQLLILRVVQSN